MSHTVLHPSDYKRKTPIIFPLIHRSTAGDMSSNSGFQGVSNCYVFKSLLQEYAQKVKLPTPVYDTIKEGPSHEPSFKSTVIVNDVRYDSLPGFFNRKAAEQSAAEVALIQLANSGGMNESAAQPVHEMGLCKNLLQEYAQKMNYAIPSYECQKNEKPGREGFFSCTVEIGGMKYIGAAARTKKDAEIKAARTALLAIQSSGYGSSGVPGDNSIYTVTPSKKKSTDVGVIPQETTAALKPKKGPFKKKLRKKRRDRCENKGNLEVNMDNQAVPELNQSDALADEKSEGNEEEISAAKDASTPFVDGNSNDGQLTALNSNESNQGNRNKEVNSMICGGDLNVLMKEVNNEISEVGQVDTMVNHSTVCLGEVPSATNGLNQTTDGMDACQTNGETIGD